MQLYIQSHQSNCWGEVHVESKEKIVMSKESKRVTLDSHVFDAIAICNRHAFDKVGL
jgi:hypothetical protein